MRDLSQDKVPFWYVFSIFEKLEEKGTHAAFSIFFLKSFILNFKLARKIKKKMKKVQNGL